MEEVAFRILKNKCASVTSMFGVDESLPVHAYFDASQFAGGFAMMHIVKGVERPIIYDSFSCTTTQRNYDTYKRELLTIVTFAEKHKHHFTTRHPTTFYTDHLPLISFINSDRHEGIYARWWPRKGPDIRAYIDCCIQCARFGPAIRSHTLQPTFMYHPFDMIGIDFIGPLPKSINGFSHIFHVIDYFSRYTKSWATKTNTRVT